MHKGIKPKEPVMNSPAPTTQPVAEKPAAKLFPVVLTKNYVPMGDYEIVGYLKAAVKRKDAAGTERIIEREEFIEGEMKPHNSPGVGFGEYIDEKGRKTNAKIWAGTTIKLPIEEAKSLVAKKIAERADAIAA